MNRPASEFVGAKSYNTLNRQTSVGGLSSEEEKNHVIRVLEHESKVYRFERNVMSMGNMDADYYSEQGRNPRNVDL